MSNQKPPVFSDSMRWLYQQLAPQDIEQFYVGYQYLEAEQLSHDLQSQITALQQQIIENIGNIQATQPSAVAMAALVRLQSVGVQDNDLLDFLLLRGEEWLDQTMQRLDYCEQMGLIEDNDYTKWCEHALDGAYDWIDSMREANNADAPEVEDFASNQSHEPETSENPLDSLPLMTEASELETENTDPSDPNDQTVSEENLLKLLASDDEDEPTEKLSPLQADTLSDTPVEMPAFLSELEIQHVGAKLFTNDADADLSASDTGIHLPTSDIVAETSPADVNPQIPSEAIEEVLPEVAPENSAEIDSPISPETAPENSTEADLLPLPETASDQSATTETEDITEEEPIDPQETTQSREAISAASLAEKPDPAEETDSTEKIVQVTTNTPVENPKKEKSGSGTGIMAALIALKKKHMDHTDPPSADKLTEMQVEEATVELETAEAIGGGLLAPSEISQPDEAPEAQEDAPEARQETQNEALEESAPSIPEWHAIDQDAQPINGNQMHETTTQSARQPNHHSTTSVGHNSPFLVERAHKKNKKHKDVKSRNSSRHR
ncbi:MAG TPA: hypothetical protein VFN23_15695 [Ktedonobacteraceae bacterium]|nr:hypothetical protein [Ktedonobacteraceae bacterium]